MAKPLLISVILLQPFSNYEADTKHDLSPDLAQRLIDRGVAERCTPQADKEPEKETIVKTTKSKKK